jgi:Thiol:disulfide interchange protein
LQQPLLVGVLACVMLAVGLSMSGMVQFGVSLGNTGANLASRSGPAGDFFTGVLAVVVASPCTRRSWAARWRMRSPRRCWRRCWCFWRWASDWRCRSC